MWSFLIWVKHLIISSVLAWAGVNMITPDHRRWEPVIEQTESANPPCQERREIEIRSHGSSTRVMSIRAKACTFSETQL